MHVGGRAGRGQGDERVEVDAEDVERAVECVPGGIVVDEGEVEGDEERDEDERDEEENELESEESEESEDSDESSSSSEEETPFITSSGPALPPISTIRMIRAPFVHVPSLPTFPFGSDAQATGGKEDATDEGGEDGRGDIAEAWRMDEEEFNETEEKEIEKEEEIEERDSVISEVAEKGMWEALERERELRVEQSEVGNEMETEKRKTKNASRKVKEGNPKKKGTAARGKQTQEDGHEDVAMEETEDAHRRIKSTAYIEDSGEE
jgi:hypothetical protein